jgi:hypothetical protein
MTDALLMILPYMSSPTTFLALLNAQDPDLYERLRRGQDLQDEVLVCLTPEYQGQHPIYSTSTRNKAIKYV